MGALNLYRQAVDRAGVAKDNEGNLISMEIGGTSCDVLLMSGGEVATRDEVMIAGYHVSTPAIDIHTVGAGGGTIAGVDSAGMLYVGPEGAGADPGPACYGRGGVRADGGRMRNWFLDACGLAHPPAARLISISKRRARRFVRRWPSRLDSLLKRLQLASLIWWSNNLLHAVEHISIERGHSPRRFTLVAAGGAGPMHGAAIAHGLGCEPGVRAARRRRLVRHWHAARRCTAGFLCAL